MKNIRYIFFWALFSLPGCQRYVGENIEQGAFIIQAWTESGGDTKTSLSGREADGKYYALWTTGDRITVYVDGSTMASDFTLVSGAGTANGSFAGAISGVSFVGFYPASMISDEGLQDNVLNIEIPQNQDYTTGTFAPDLFPMIAVGKASHLSFKNLCAILKVSMTGDEQVNSIEFKPADETKIVSGKATVRVDFGNGAPRLEMAESGSNSVTLYCGSVQLNPTLPTDFYLIIPPGTYRGGFSLNIKTFRGVVIKTTSQDVTFERSQLRAIPSFECVGTGEDDYENVPYNQIWYVTEDNSMIDLEGRELCNSKVLRHSYENGKGIIECDNPITRINDSAFDFLHKVTSIYLPNSIEELGSYALRGTKIKQLRLPDNLNYVETGALMVPTLELFTGASSSEDGRCVIFEDGFMPFYGNAKVPVKNILVAFAPAGISEYSIPSNVEVLGWYAFANCPELRSIIFNEGLKSIMGECFSDNQLDCEIVLPSTLESVNPYAFLHCRGIRKFSGNPRFHTEDGLCLTFQMENIDSSLGDTWLCKFVGDDVVDYIIPEGVVGIENYTFDQMTNLRSVTLPTSIVEVASYAFYNCQNLEALYGECTDASHKAIVFGNQFKRLVLSKGVTEYTVPDGITSLGYNSFSECPDLREITVPDSVIELGGYDFAWCPNLVRVVLSSNLKRVNRWNPFLGSDKLTEIYFRSPEPPEYSDTQFYESECSHLTVYVPEESLESYKHSGWFQYAPYMIGYHYDDVGTPDYYISEDYTHDGEVATLQTATLGNGINLVLMGDAFTDKQVADGTYNNVMNRMMEAFFCEEPYTTLRPMFNVYAVTVVSATEGYDHGGQALNGFFGDGTLVGGNDIKCLEIARSVVGNENMDQTLIIVAMNSPAYAGTCYMFYPSSGDYGEGAAIAYFPIGEDEEDLAPLVHHEAGGHGFAKLADEYVYEGTIPDDEKQSYVDMFPFGWWKNIDFTSDPGKVKWMHFLNDNRYIGEGLGVFEGGATYPLGVWRPTENSIMRYNVGGYNAPSREAIWYRAHKIAYGDSWQYDYEDFVSYDAINRKVASGTAASPHLVARPVEPLHAPKVVPMSWREVLKFGETDIHR